eukprot:3104358-Pleurochrysis_carterae.AAC.4
MVDRGQGWRCSDSSKGRGKVKGRKASDAACKGTIIVQPEITLPGTKYRYGGGLIADDPHHHVATARHERNYT